MGALWVQLGCTRNVRLVMPDTSPGARYLCTETSCTAAQVIDPSRDNRRHTYFVALPKQCGGRVHEILVLSAESKRPEIEVTCAPREEDGVGDME
ncbi:MAG: hypothetical protein RLZZ450_1044 [Pseudomonadota bacterium]